ncbi:MAG TPA: 4-hydroxy-tetrahydrodipicolinate reductase [Caulobacteraceae bacterium]|jgi:4-hydroxy-tetrahydrodipicolinate reductase
MVEPSKGLRLGVAGALGRMGQTVLAVAADEAGVAVTAALDRPDCIGQSTGALMLVGADEALAACDVLIDFSTAAAAAQLARAAASRGGPALIIGATGFSEADEATIAGAARAIAIVRSGNFSLGVNLLAALVEEAARRLPADWDIEILEAHHRRKVDAPSGTALMLGEAAARGRKADLAKVAARGRDGLTGPRPADAIGFASLRAGGLIGEHSVILATEDEILTLSHSARDRRLFARGAIAAARWVQGRRPGLYDMRDVLGLT